jgi:hypothetical protein
MYLKTKPKPILVMPLNGRTERGYAWSIGVAVLLLATACTELVKPPFDVMHCMRLRSRASMDAQSDVGNAQRLLIQVPVMKSVAKYDVVTSQRGTTAAGET